MIRRFVGCILAIAAALAPASPAAAEPPAAQATTAKPTPAQVTAAGDLWKRGREAVKAEDWPKALELLRESQRLDPTPGTLFNIANCEEHVGQIAGAVQHFQQVILALKAHDSRIAVAREHAAALATRVPRLVVDLAPGSPPFARVRLGDDDVPLGRELPLDPGPRTLTVSAPGRPDRAVDLTLAEGDQRHVTVEVGAEAKALAPAPVVAAPPPAPPRSPVNVRLAAGIGLGALGVVGLGVGAVTGALALGRKNDLEAACPVKSACTSAGVDAAGAGSTLATGSTIAFALGAAAVAGGLALVLTSRGGKGDTPKASAVLAPAGAGLAIRGAF